MLRILEQIHAGSETNGKVGSGSEKIMIHNTAFWILIKGNARINTSEEGGGGDWPPKSSLYTGE
jgi:hypothetical protein